MEIQLFIKCIGINSSERDNFFGPPSIVDPPVLSLELVTPFGVTSDNICEFFGIGVDARSRFAKSPSSSRVINSAIVCLFLLTLH